MTRYREYIEALPQRKPFLFIDELEQVDTGKSAVGSVVFAADHPVFDGHLPSMPLVPGVIVIEALAQLAGVLLVGAKGEVEPVLGYLAEVKHLRFHRLVRPGERVVLRARLQRKFLSVASFEVSAEVDGELTAEGTLVVGGMREK